MPPKNNFISEQELFNNLKNEFLNYDPAVFTKNCLILDKKPFNVLDNGWKFMADVYRYIALQATAENGKPVVICKGRQIGATVMAGALDLYFTNSGLFNNPPIRVAHLFPQHALAKRFIQDKLESLITDAKDDFINKNKLETQNAVDNLNFKQFKNGSLWIDSLGKDADRIRGMTLDVLLVDECFPKSQYIETEFGKEKIGNLYNMFISGKELPLIKCFNEETEEFEYKQIKNAWKREKRDLITLHLGKRIIRCTPNHKFLTSTGWAQASNITAGTLIKSSSGSSANYIRALNDDQEQVLLGSFLGNGNVADGSGYKKEAMPGRYRLRVIHGIKQIEYCSWKAEIFNSKIEIVKNAGYSKTDFAKFVSKTFALENSLPNNKTYCPQWVLDKLDLRGIAIWLMDDGSINKWETGCSICLSTCSFDEDSQKRIVEKFKSLGIDATYRCSKKSGEKIYYSIYFNKEAAIKLSNMLIKYIHPTMMYKIWNPNNIENTPYKFNNKFKNYGYFIVDKISTNSEKEYVYDIEIEQNHNFIVTSSTGNKKKSHGGPIAHNCQDALPIAIGNASKTLTSAKYGPPGKGVQVYFGTPKGKDSFLFASWENSDKRYYHLGCSNCHETFPFYQSGSDSWQKIWVYGHIIQCPYCGHKQTKIESIELGKWVSSRLNDADDCRYVGFHINQLYHPSLSKEHILDLMPENNPNQLERLWKNEVIGEFYAGVGLPITKLEVLEKCMDRDRAFAKKIESNEKKVYLGIDWGEKVDNDDIVRGQSFSCAVVLSSTPDGMLQVEHAHKLRQNNLEYKRDTVHELFRRFGVRQAIADFFYGQDVVRELQKSYHSRFLGAQGSGQLIKALKYRDDELIVSYNKDLLIDEILSLFRKGYIRFPWKSYEYLEWLIDHCTSMETSIKMVGGQSFKTYKKGNIPNDGLMALMYAYMAYKFDVTKGFTIAPGTKQQTEFLKPTVAYLPNIRF